ncbi:hypothetical protein D9611_001400 [Ephemerocybe angulata]|uniref:DUF6533 domain-containing protein n=1 Tax=Ephemerocybe angulata TaxID=980116 RepID=A0A8H5CIJ9_9AGAR|nr:hypothetical protein D9611_001400 [Tulosesus angulatus]
MQHSQEEIARFTTLYTLSLIPLRVVLASMTWVIYDYFSTLEDEVRYIWSQNRCLGKISYLFIRYYTILLLVFDVIQIHTMSKPSVATRALCVAMDPTVRIVGAVSLWAIEVVMQIRVYALFNCSRKVAIFNGVLFGMSVAAFLGLLMRNTMVRAQVIDSVASDLPLYGCPPINGGVAWAIWLPAVIATSFELVIFGFVLYKSTRSLTFTLRLKKRWSLMDIIIQDNMLYYIGITAVLLFNAVMASGAYTLIPWFSYGPFHAAMGMMTTRMLMHVRKAAVKSVVFADSGDANTAESSYFEAPRFVVPETVETSSLHSVSSAGGSSTIVSTATVSSSNWHDVDLERNAGAT